jgi:hypothetical protein
VAHPSRAVFSNLVFKMKAKFGVKLSASFATAKQRAELHGE